MMVDQFGVLTGKGAICWKEEKGQSELRVVKTAREPETRVD